MRIVCPACTATYNVPEVRLAPGRAVRCARCGTDWMPLGVEAPPLQPAGETLPSVPEPVVAPPPSPAATARSRRADAVALAGWAVSLALLAALGWGGVRWRDNVMHAWPPSERLYAALGLVPDQAAQ